MTASSDGRSTTLSPPVLTLPVRHPCSRPPSRTSSPGNHLDKRQVSGGRHPDEMSICEHIGKWSLLDVASAVAYRP